MHISNVISGKHALAQSDCVIHGLSEPLGTDWEYFEISPARKFRLIEYGDDQYHLVLLVGILFLRCAVVMMLTSMDGSPQTSTYRMSLTRLLMESRRMQRTTSLPSTRLGKTCSRSLGGRTTRLCIQRERRRILVRLVSFCSHLSVQR